MSLRFCFTANPPCAAPGIFYSLRNIGKCRNEYFGDVPIGNSVRHTLPDNFRLCVAVDRMILPPDDRPESGGNDAQS